MTGPEWRTAWVNPPEPLNSNGARTSMNGSPGRQPDRYRRTVWRDNFREWRITDGKYTPPLTAASEISGMNGQLAAAPPVV